MKKIVHITSELQRFLVDLMMLQNNDFKFKVILTRVKNEYIDELKALGVEFFHKRDLGFFGVIRRLNAANLVHTHLYPPIYIAYFTNTLTVATEHNPHYRRRDLPFIKTLESIIYKKLKKIICISEGVKTKFLESIKASISKTYVINNGVNLERFSQTAKILSADAKVINIGMVGRFAPQKDIKTLLKLMTLLDDRFVLNLAGDGELRSEYEVYALSLGVNNKVKFLGQVNDIPTFLDSLDIYVQSSHWEGFSIAVEEAMAAGLPTFSSNVEGLNHAVDQNSLFEVGDKKDLASKIEGLINDTELFSHASQLSIVRAKKFSIQQTAIEHSKMYASLMELN